MKVKEINDPLGKKVIDPNTGSIGFMKGYFPQGIFLSSHNSCQGVIYPVFVDKNEFLEWELTKEKTTIKKPKKMIKIAPDLCIYCLEPADEVRTTKLYIVGVCKGHDTLSDQEINDIIKDDNSETHFD